MYKTFQNWLFDGNIKSKIPTGEGIPEILKYNSPINHTYLISLFLNQSKLNFYLNSYFNNMNLRYLDKEELMRFIKKCVIDFNVQRKNLAFVPYKRYDKLYNALRKKIPVLKNHEIKLLSEIIENSDIKNEVYNSLSLEKPDQVKTKKTSKAKKSTKKETIDDFLKNNFKVMKV